MSEGDLAEAAEQADAPEDQPAPQDPKDAEIAKLRKERDDAKGWARKEAAARLSTTYGVEITPDKLRKIDVGTLEEILQQARPAGAQDTDPKADKPEEPSPEQQAAVAAAAAFVQKDAAPQTPAGQITYEEAAKMGGPTNPQVRELIAKGLVEGIEPTR